jgi:hypothetical protein
MRRIVTSDEKVEKLDSEKKIPQFLDFMITCDLIKDGQPR